MYNKLSVFMFSYLKICAHYLLLHKVCVIKANLFHTAATRFSLHCKLNVCIVKNTILKVNAAQRVSYRGGGLHS